MNEEDFKNMVKHKFPKDILDEAKKEMEFTAKEFRMLNDDFKSFLEINEGINRKELKQFFIDHVSAGFGSVILNNTDSFDEAYILFDRFYKTGKDIMHKMENHIIHNKK